MIYSMTGYGQGTYSDESTSLSIEIKSVNSRYLDINIRMPRKIGKYEEYVKSIIKEEISRGKVDIYISMRAEDRSDIDVKADHELMGKYFEVYNGVIEKFGIENDIRLSHLLNIPNAIIVDDNELEEEYIKDILRSTTIASIDSLREMRAVEGEKLRSDILQRKGNMKDLLSSIEEKSPEIVSSHKESMVERIKELLSSEDSYSEDRLEMEVAIFADRKDITEEIVRLGSHFEQMDKMLDSEVPVGRKLDFLIQEMNREVNTIGSKAAGIDITSNVIELKSEIERIREQVQNIE